MDQVRGWMDVAVWSLERCFPPVLERKKGNTKLYFFGIAKQDS